MLDSSEMSTNISGDAVLLLKGTGLFRCPLAGTPFDLLRSGRATLFTSGSYRRMRRRLKNAFLLLLKIKALVEQERDAGPQRVIADAAVAIAEQGFQLQDLHF